MEHARALWEELDLYPLNVQSPWHGYGLGDWSDRWETFGARAPRETGLGRRRRTRAASSPSPRRIDDCQEARPVARDPENWERVFGKDHAQNKNF